MNVLFIKKPFATFSLTDRINCDDKGIRTYRASPEDVMVQIRGHTEKRGQLAAVHLTADEARSFAAKLIELANEIDAMAIRRS